MAALNGVAAMPIVCARNDGEASGSEECLGGGTCARGEPLKCTFDVAGGRRSGSGGVGAQPGRAAGELLLGRESGDGGEPRDVVGGVVSVERHDVGVGEDAGDGVVELIAGQALGP